jgi:hypothetical protein
MLTSAALLFTEHGYLRRKEAGAAPVLHPLLTTRLRHSDAGAPELRGKWDGYTGVAVSDIDLLLPLSRMVHSSAPTRRPELCAHDVAGESRDNKMRRRSRRNNGNRRAGAAFQGPPMQACLGRKRAGPHRQPGREAQFEQVFLPAKGVFGVCSD